jgi:hypothetical protein
MEHVPPHLIVVLAFGMITSAKSHKFRNEAETTLWLQ